jgi:carbonic anhydrase
MDLFANNRKWAEDIKQSDPDYFTNLSEQQNPEYLWIGCSDSRVPPEQILGLLPGEIFVHRNIANMVIESDPNCLSVIRYAVEALKVKHIIVCGHYGCGGMQAALADHEVALDNNWLKHIKEVRSRHQEKLDTAANKEQKLRLICELNVIDQVASVSRLTPILKAWESGQPLSVHGWIYSLEEGLLKKLIASIDGVQQNPG